MILINYYLMIIMKLTSHHPEFYTKLTPLLINGKVKDPIINFSLLYNNRVLIKNFTKEYATKILNEYPKSLTFVVADIIMLLASS